MAAGEMSREEFAAFNRAWMSSAALYLVDGGEFRDACERRQKVATEARASIAIQKVKPRAGFAPLNGEERSGPRSPSAGDGHQFESPPLHHEVAANHPGFPARRGARDYVVDELEPVRSSPQNNTERFLQILIPEDALRRLHSSRLSPR
jgi:hypothetical protein